MAALSSDDLTASGYGVGDRATAFGLVGAAQYNGCSGVIQSELVEGRHTVALSVPGQPGFVKKVKLKPANLSLAARAYKGGPAVLRDSGEVCFAPQTHIFCGHCNAPPLGCMCRQTQMGHGVDFNFM